MQNKKYQIPFNKPFMTGKEMDYIVQSVLVEAHLSGDGPFTKRCHRWLEERLGCRKAFLTHSCTGALELAALLCDIHPGDEVIMPSFTFVSTANAFVLRGGVPVFVDIRADTLNLNEALIESAITPRTRAIVPVHYAGVACAMDEIENIAKGHDFWIVEDAAHAFLSTYGGRPLGALGHLGCFSFHETKNIITGEGGALLVNDERLVERAEILREKGTNRTQFFRGEVDRYTWVDVGSSFLPSELVGCFLYAQLEQAERINAFRRRMTERYAALLRPLEEEGFLRLPHSRSECQSNGHLFYLLANNPEDRNRLLRYLNDRGIMAIFHYVPLHSSPAGKRYGRASGRLRITEDVSERLIRLPLFYEMKEGDMDQVVETIYEFYGERG